MTIRLLYIFLLIGQLLSSQNLVPNAGFEEHISKRFSKKGAWQKCMSADTPDYFTDSVSTKLFKKYMGGSEPHSGSSFIGLFIYRKQEDKKGEVREFVQAELLKPLKRDTFYYVEAYLKLDEESNVLCDGFTVYFSDTLVSPKKIEMMYDHTPQVLYRARHYLDSKDGWVKFSGSFRAKGNEKYMILGNLKADEQTNTRDTEVHYLPKKKRKWYLQPGEQVAYVYVDDVVVMYSDSLNKHEPADYLKPKSLAWTPDKRKKEISLKTQDPGKEEQQLLAYLSQTTQVVAKTGSTTPVHADSANFRTTPLKKGQVFNLKNIQFEYDKAQFKNEAIPELNDLVRLMRENKTMEIEIQGHTDNHGSQQYNVDLSIARANAVEKFLLKNAISKKRIQSFGFGSSKPIDTNDTEEGRARNRRIELIITKE